MSAGKGRAAVVLGGGGLAGIGWTVGVLAAWEDAGTLALSTVEQVIGTSAGASVGAAVLARGSATAMFDELVRAGRRTHEIAPFARLDEVFPEVLAVHAASDPLAVKAERFVALSRARALVDPVLRRDAIARRIGAAGWPASLAVTAVRADGETVVFDRAAGVGLVDAVTASCAVPGLWPAVELDGAVLVDGGTFSSTNADLAAAADHVVVLAPQPEQEQYLTPARRSVLERALVLEPSSRSRAGFGDDPFDPEVRGIAAVLGYEDGARAASSL